MRDEPRPPRGPDGRQPLVEAEAHEPRDERAGSPFHVVEDVRRRVVAAGGQPVGREDAEERDEERAEEIEEVLVVPEVQREREPGGDQRRPA